MTFAFLRLLALPLALATTVPARAIVGPSAAGSPLAASIVMVLNHQGQTAGFCTGIVLAPDIVMTAAHCTPKGSDLRIHWPGDPSKPALLPVNGIAVHPDYHADAIRSRERSVDLAMVRLATPLPDRFAPATLAKTAAAKVGDRFTIAGYGLAREGEGASSGQLRSTTLATRAPLSGVLLWAADAGGSGACTGDSGGPVTREGSDAVVALVLWTAGAGSRQCGQLTQSLWLAPHRAWIRRVLQAWGHAPL